MQYKRKGEHRAVCDVRRGISIDVENLIRIQDETSCVLFRIGRMKGGERLKLKKIQEFCPEICQWSVDNQPCFRYCRIIVENVKNCAI